ncbi:MAG: ATP-binding protein [Gemmatimonadetes bacterium]|nr:ATP-binding protein [Gemmatimonadota bacterium]
MTIETIDRQRRYVQEQKEKGNGLGVVFADAFLRGMRDLGYKNPAWALAEMMDNAFQAAAGSVAIRFGFERGNKTEVKPDFVAICDDGNGMIPEMIGYAVRWGGTDREGDRKGFGRYGYGLPSSAVSLAKRYTVYSKPRDGEWHAVTVDIDELAAAASDLKKTEALLSPRPATLPEWLLQAPKGDDALDLNSLKSGTVILLEDLDRLRSMGGWIKAESLRTKLLQHFGVIYRHWIPERRIVVDGRGAQSVDPLFLMEHARFSTRLQYVRNAWRHASWRLRLPAERPGGCESVPRCCPRIFSMPIRCSTEWRPSPS